MSNAWTLEIYFIGMPRSDGKPPSFEKAVDDNVFYSRESAEAFCKTLPGGWQVFKALVTVPWEQA